jgi:ATP-dependent protease ClpP protease subunit
MSGFFFACEGTDMPLPKPREDEEKQKFVSRCMSELKEEYPDNPQRLAICFSQWRKRESGDGPMSRSWYEIRDAADVAEVMLYDAIGAFGVTAAQFVKDLQGIRAKAINLRVNSPGGDVFDGVAIYNSLKDHKATVNVVVDGLAASSASFITQAGDSVLMATGATMMIHEPFGMTLGDSADHAKMSETLDKMGGTIASLYAGRAGGDEGFWRGKMKDETWYRAEEAVAANLADGLVHTPKAQAPVGIFNLSKFKHVPEWLNQEIPKPEPEPAPEPVPADTSLLEAMREGIGQVYKKHEIPPHDYKSDIREGILEAQKG